jgi:hypothetical protein
MIQLFRPANRAVLCSALVITFIALCIPAAAFSYGYISGMTLVTPEKGYFVGYADWGNNTLYSFNPTTGEVHGPANDLLKEINIAGLESGISVDKNGNLWVCDQTKARIVVLNTETDEIDESINTELNPIRVVFTVEAQTGNQTAVVATVASDFSSGAHSVIAVDPVGGPRQAQNRLLATISDITIAAHANHFYRIEKFQANNVAKFDIAAPETVIWQFSTEGAEEDSNPYDLIFVNSQKAYLLRYGSATAWIVNPSAATEADFKIGVLDLSAYDGGGGVPHMNSAVIADGKLFIAMQRLDSFWQPSNDAYVAVFDVATDEEIDTGTQNGDGLKGIRLPIRNTGAIQYLETDSAIYVQGAGDFFGGGSQDDFPSGIVRIDLQHNYDVQMVLEGGFFEEAPEVPSGGGSGGCFINSSTGSVSFWK